jgi:two-component system, response regulator
MREVLLLEHNPIDARLIINALQQISIDICVEWVCSTRAALDYVSCTGTYASRSSDQSLKLILLDVAPSDMECIELLSMLKNYAETRILPIVVLVATRSHVPMFKQANSCIVKAADSDQLHDTVERLGRYWLTVNKSMDDLVRLEAAAAAAS